MNYIAVAWRLNRNLRDLNRYSRPPERWHISQAAAGAICSEGSGEEDSSICTCSTSKEDRISAYRLLEFITLSERELKVHTIIDL